MVDIFKERVDLYFSKVKPGSTITYRDLVKNIGPGILIPGKGWRLKLDHGQIPVRGRVVMQWW